MNKIRLAIAVALVGFVVGCQQESPPQPIQPQLQPGPGGQVAPPEKPRLMPEKTYQGTWLTGGERKRKLNGTMTSVVTNTSENQWKGRFFGVWQGVKFDYTVTFSGTPDKLTGTATIDHADYTWNGSIVNGEFKGTFTSSRYDGNFNLKEK